MIADVISETKIWQRENGKLVDFSDRFDDVEARNAFEYLQINDLYCQKLESSTYIFATDSIGLCLIVYYFSCNYL